MGAMDVHVMCGLLGLVWCLSCELFISRGPRAGDAGFFDPHICCCPDAGVAVAFGQHDGLEPHNHRVQSVGKKVPGVVVGSKSAKGKAHQPPRLREKRTSRPGAALGKATRVKDHGKGSRTRISLLAGLVLNARKSDRCV